MRILSVIALFFFSVSTASAGFADFSFGIWSLGSKKGTQTLVLSADLTSTASVLSPARGTGPGTFTGGGQWVADNAGVLQFVASGNPAIPGSRIAANVCYESLADGTPIAGIKGVLLEPARTNKFTGYSVIPADSYAATKTSGTLVIGRKYEIVTTSVDYFGAGLVIGNQFISTSALTCSGTNSAKEVILAIGTIAKNSGGSTLAVPGMTLSGDATATLSVVDDTAGLAAAGLQNICSTGKVYKLDNVAGGSIATVALSGTVGNTNPHSISVYTSRISGTHYIGRLNADSLVVVSSGSGYVKRVAENTTPSATFETMTIKAGGGAVIYFILPQLEEGPTVSSPIITAGGTASRTATIYSEPVVNLRANNISGTIDWTPTSADPLARWLWGAYTDASNYYGVYRDGTAGTFVFRKRIAGVNYDASYTIAVTPGTTYKVGWRMGAAGVDIFVNGVKGTGNANTANAAVPVAWQIGSDGNGANQGTPRVKNLRIYWENSSDAAMIARTI